MNILKYHIKIITLMVTYIALKISGMCNDPSDCLSVHPFLMEFCLSVVKQNMAEEELSELIAQLINQSCARKSTANVTDLILLVLPFG